MQKRGAPRPVIAKLPREISSTGEASDKHVQKLANAISEPFTGNRAVQKRITGGIALILSLTAYALPSAAATDDFDATRTTYGEIGLLETPTARMAPDGQLSATIAILEGTQRYNFDFQATPWLEGSFRYAGIDNFGGFKTYYDRSFGLKIRLLQESSDLPEISLGIRDLLGTGIYSSEYLVGSKRFGDFDLSMGVGWGRLSDSGALINPLAQIFKSFETRGGGPLTGGSVAFNALFHGPNIGLFGGGAWHTPIENLDVMVEYSSDRYFDETSVGDIKIRMPVNIGVAYHPYEFITVAAGWLYGTSYGLSLTLAADPSIPTSPFRVGPTVPVPVIRSDQDQSAALSMLVGQHALLPLGSPFITVNHTADSIREIQASLFATTVGIRNIEPVGKTLMVDAHTISEPNYQCSAYARVISAAGAPFDTVAVSDIESGADSVAVCRVGPAKTPLRPKAIDIAKSQMLIREGVAAQGLTVEALEIQGAELWLYFRNDRYRSESEAVGRISRILMATAPSNVEMFHIVDVKKGIAMREARIARSGLERLATVHGTVSEEGDAIALMPPPLSNPILDRALADAYPRFHWSLGPNIRQGFFDPNQPIQFQLFAQAAGEIELAPGLAIDARGEVNLYDDYDLKRTSNSVLPHVRSDVVEYIRHGINGIPELDASYRTRISSDTFGEIKVGILESMFAGAGGQVLWRPEGQRFAIGADLYQVWQRGFDRLFDLRDYHVVTGHVTIYYASPWYGFNFALHGGRYLAGDYGGTFEITRKFSTGVEIGAFATFTNVPFSKFGEGSFDKGIIVRIPFEWGLPFYSQSSYDLTLHSLTRDGGARLENDDSLYDETESTSYDEMADHIDDIATP